MPKIGKLTRTIKGWVGVCIMGGGGKSTQRNLCVKAVHWDSADFESWRPF